MIRILLVLSISTSVFAKTSSEQPVVVGCHDGDTCKLVINNDLKSIRISGVDAPENGQPYAKDAQQFTLKFIKSGKKIKLNCDGTSYARDVCFISVDGEDVGQALVRAGLAYDSPKYSHKKYDKDMQYAKGKKIGVWSSLKELISPFCKRKGTKHPKCKNNHMYMP